MKHWLLQEAWYHQGIMFKTNYNDNNDNDDTIPYDTFSLQSCSKNILNI